MSMETVLGVLAFPHVTTCQLLHKKTVEAYDAKLEQKRVEFVKLKEDLNTAQAAASEHAAVTAVSNACSLFQESYWGGVIGSDSARIKGCDALLRAVVGVEERAGGAASKREHKGRVTGCSSQGSHRQGYRSRGAAECRPQTLRRAGT